MDSHNQQHLQVAQVLLLALTQLQCHAIRVELKTHKVLPVLLHAVPAAYPASLTHA